VEVPYRPAGRHVAPLQFPAAQDLEQRARADVPVRAAEQHARGPEREQRRDGIF
jgi:hypothetical protein